MNEKRKLIGILLTVILVMSSATFAYASENENTPYTIVDHDDFNDEIKQTDEVQQHSSEEPENVLEISDYKFNQEMDKSGLGGIVTELEFMPMSAGANLIVTPLAWSIGPAANNTTVTVTSNINWNQITSSNTSWLTFSNVTPVTRTGNGSLRINATANTGTTQRTGTITIVGGGITRRITVTQAGRSLTLSRSTWALSTPAANNVTVNVTSNITWATPSSNATSWLTVSSITRNGTNGSFQINATANTGTTQRSGTITVTGGGITRTITVTQPGRSLTLSRSGWAISNPASSNVTVNVTANISWSNPTSNNTSWLTVSNITRNGTNGSFAINATANTGTTSRTGTITVTGGGITRTISVTQPGRSLTLSASSWGMSGPAASNTTVNVTANIAWNNPTSNNTSWLTVSNIARDGTNGSFRINAIANTGTTQRSGTITVTGGGITRTVTVTQPGRTLTVSQSSWVIDSPETNNTTINVTSNISWENPTSDSISWLTVSNVSRSGTNGSFRINATANTGATPRTGRISVTGGGILRTISVTQPGRILSLSRTTPWEAVAAESNIVVNVTSNVIWNVTSSNTNWLTVTNITPTNRNGNGSFRINTTANISGERSGTITVTSGTITRTIDITQAAGALTLSQVSWNPPITADNTTVNVTSRGTWSVSSDASWLTVTNITPANRTGNGSFRINVTANTGAQREGIITATTGAVTRTITVTQAESIVWPMPSRQGLGTDNITSPFGERKFDNRHHNGIDIDAFTNERVNSMMAGTVISSGWWNGGGDTVQVKHSNDYSSVYMHLNRRDVSLDNSVVAGQQIGGAGNTGKSDGVHLHFEIRNRSDTAINPLEIWHWDDPRASSNNPNPVFVFRNGAFTFNTNFTWP